MLDYVTLACEIQCCIRENKTLRDLSVEMQNCAKHNVSEALTNRWYHFEHNSKRVVSLQFQAQEMFTLVQIN